MLCRTRAAFNVSHCVFHSWKTELETRSQQPTWDDAAALDDQFGLSPVKIGRNLEHPSSGRQSKRHATLPTNDTHHLSLGNWVWRGHVDRLAKVISVD